MTDQSEESVKSPTDEEIQLFILAAKEILSLINKTFPCGELPIQEITRPTIVNSEVKNVTEKQLNQFF